MSKQTLIQSNFGIEGMKKYHPVVIFENQIYWWKNCNKDLKNFIVIYGMNTNVLPQ